MEDGDASQAVQPGIGDRNLNALKRQRAIAQKALDALTASTTAETLADATRARDELAAQRDTVEDVYKKYRALPHEADAAQVGDTASEAFKAL